MQLPVLVALKTDSRAYTCTSSTSGQSCTSACVKQVLVLVL